MLSLPESLALRKRTGAAAALTALLLLLVAPLAVSAQAQAVRAFDPGLDTWLRFRADVAMERYAAALARDPNDALTTALAVGRLPTADRGAVLDRAVAAAAAGSTEELLLVAAAREAHRGNLPAARALRKAAADVAKDPRLRLYAAWMLPVPDRKEIHASLMADHPDFAPAAAARAWALVPNVFVTVSPAELEEAERAARTALRLEPDQPYTHLVLAQVLLRKGARDEARTHLGHATSSPHHLAFAYNLLAQTHLQDGELPEARRVLERGIAATTSDAVRRDARQAIALTYLHEGDLARTLSAYEELAAEAEAAGFTPASGGYYATAALLAAGADDARAFDRYRAEAERRLNETANPQWLIISNAFLGRADASAAALERLLVQMDGNHSVAAEEARERMRGYVELARDRPAAALAHFERAGRNPYAQLGMWEALRRTGDRKAAEAVRTDLLTRKDFSLMSTATPIARYRARRSS